MNTKLLKKFRRKANKQVRLYAQGDSCGFIGYVVRWRKDRGRCFGVSEFKEAERFAFEKRRECIERMLGWEKYHRANPFIVR